MGEKKILPFGKPILSYEPTVSHITGIMATDFERFQCAFYNNFIDIALENAVDFYEFRNWLRYNMFESHKIPRRIAFGLSEEEIIKIICRWIDQNHYVLVLFETFYVSKYPTYQRQRFRHYAMILGYDLNKMCFICGDFFDFTYYTVEECSMHEVVQAIIHNGDINATGFSKDFTLLRIDEKSKPELDFNKIIMSLNMLVAENNRNMKRQYGLSIFDRICEKIAEGDLVKYYNEFIRHPQFVYVHMEAMIMRMEYFQKNIRDLKLMVLIADLQRIQSEIEQYRNYVIKLRVKSKDEFPVQKRKNYIEKITIVKQEYILIIKKFIHILMFN